jgi:hypothetical protein
LAKDSATYSDGNGQNGVSSDVYNGKAADYFEFTNEGKLYIQENGAIDTANYTINTDKSVTINYLVYNGVPVNSYGSNVVNFRPVNLTGTSVTLTSSLVSPAGILNRTINLKR